jgi:predicted nuclease of predicted toxin-antitoxin system
VVETSLGFKQGADRKADRRRRRRGLKFYLDENITPDIAPAAARLGIDATSARAAGMLGKTDEEQLAYAASEGRCIVTCDVEDFNDLARRWRAADRSHAGILLVSRKINSDRSGEVARALLRLNDAQPDQTLADLLLWLNLESDG